MQIGLLTFPKRQTPKRQTERVILKGNFKFDENGRKFFKRVENTVGRGEIALYEQFLIFSQ